MATTLHLMKLVTLLLCVLTVAFLIVYSKLIRLNDPNSPTSSTIQPKISNLSTSVTRLKAIDTGDPNSLEARKESLVNDGGISIEIGTCAMPIAFVDAFNIADGEECNCQIWTNTIPTS